MCQWMQPGTLSETQRLILHTAYYVTFTTHSIEQKNAFNRFILHRVSIGWYAEHNAFTQTLQGSQCFPENEYGGVSDIDFFLYQYRSITSEHKQWRQALLVGWKRKYKWISHGLLYTSSWTWHPWTIMCIYTPREGIFGTGTAMDLWKNGGKKLNKRRERRNRNIMATILLWLN